MNRIVVDGVTYEWRFVEEGGSLSFSKRGYHYLLDVAQIVASWNDQQTYELEWKPEWIPFARFDCDYLCLDAKTGRVIVVFLKFPDRPVIANSFDELLAHIRAAVQSASFIITEDGLGPDPGEELAWTAIWERECGITWPEAERR